MSEASEATGPSAYESSGANRMALMMHLARVLLRVTAAAVLVLGAYAVMPVKDSDWPLWATIPIMFGGLAIFALIFYRQVRKVTNADYPVARAVEALVFLVLLFLALFASIGIQLQAEQPGSFSESMDKVDGFYFAVTTLATVGYGDITPVSTSARVVVTIQMLGNLVLLGVAVRAIGEAVRRSRDAGRGLVRGGSPQGPSSAAR